MLRCTTIKTLYTANLKANAFYGYGDEVWGNVDVVLFQEFNGASSRYQLRLIWDRGYDMDHRYWYAAVRTNRKAAPDPTPFTGRHHDDFYGSVVANNQVFGTSTEHLPDFHCPKHQCKYYGLTGPVG